MTTPPGPQRIVSPRLARALIDAQFEDLRPARVAVLGHGWDNTVFSVNDGWVFRFPRREIAVGLLELEARLMPVLAPRLPLAVPIPTLVGRGDGRYPWPFAGHRLLPGRPACRCGPDAAQRAAAAAPLGRFLAALHAIPAGEVRGVGVAPDALRRLDVHHRAAQVERRLGTLVRLGVISDDGPWRRVLGATPRAWAPGTATLVHGDLHACQVLVDDDGRPAAVIDWGDAHLGDAAVDLSVAHTFLPPAARDAFRAAYGPIDEERWRAARFRALYVAVTLATWAHETSDAALLSEASVALRHVAGADG